MTVQASTIENALPNLPRALSLNEMMRKVVIRTEYTVRNIQNLKLIPRYNTLYIKKI